MVTLISEIRNGFNNSARRFGHDALDRVKMPFAKNLGASWAVDILTTPIHLGWNAKDTNKNGEREWDTRSLVIGAKSAEAKHGTAISLGKAKAGKGQYAISVRDKAQTGDRGTAVSLAAKGANSNGKKRKAYSSTYEDRTHSNGKSLDLAA